MSIGGPGPSSVLQHKYISQAGREQGSIAASVFVSEEDGKPNGRWVAAKIHRQRVSTHVRPDGQKYARYEGYIASQPGTFFGVVLQWRSKSGALTKTWKLDDDLVAYYYLDGRALPCMRYAIYQPGGKNPLPLSGLWPDNSTRYALRWSTRHQQNDTIEPTDELYTSTDPQVPVLPPLASVDDLSSIRITLHHKTDEESSKHKKVADSSPMPQNESALNDQDIRRYHDDSLTELIDLEAPLHIPQHQLQDIFSGREAPASALPFLEFRIYYKSQETLEALGLLDDAPQSNGASNGNGVNGHAHDAEDSEELPPPLKRANGSGAADATKRQRLSEDSASPASGSAPAPAPADAAAPSVSPSTLAGPSAQSASASEEENESRHEAESAASTSRQFKAEPQSSPRGMMVDGDTDAGAGAEASEELGREPSPDAGGVDFDQGVPSPPHADRETRQAATAAFFARTPQPEARATPPVASTSAIPAAATAMVAAAVAKAEQRSPQMPTLSSQRSTTTVKLDSPMPSPTESLSDKIARRKTENQARWAAAQAFLEEEELDIAEDDYIYALLEVGFRSKARFLSSLPKCDAATRNGIFEKLQLYIPALDYGVLRSYIHENCNV